MGLTNKQRGRQLIVGGTDHNQREYLVDGAISPVLSHTALLTKAGVGAYTLAAPARSGIRLTIVNRTANAHVVTATTLVDDGVVGGSKTTLTFGAFAGASIELESHGVKWNTISVKVVVIT